MKRRSVPKRPHSWVRIIGYALAFFYGIPAIGFIGFGIFIFLTNAESKSVGQYTREATPPIVAGLAFAFVGVALVVWSYRRDPRRSE